MRDNLKAGDKQQVRKNDKKRNMDKRLKTLDEKKYIQFIMSKCVA